MTTGETEMTSTRSRQRRAAIVVALLAAGAALTACAPDPPGTPEDPSTRWLAAGCIDSVVPGVPDFHFTGVANTESNAHGFATGSAPALSEDGTCTGTPADYNSVVRSADATGAVTICAELGLTVVNPPRLIDFGYNVPIDAWACIEAPT